MKNFEEFIDALKAGETLIDRRGRQKTHLKNGQLVSKTDECLISIGFMDIRGWEVYKEPKWYEKESAIGTLCEFWNDSYEYRVIDIFTTTGIANGELSFMPRDNLWGGMYKNARQLNKSEIQIFMDKAPE